MPGKAVKVERAADQASRKKRETGLLHASAENVIVEVCEIRSKITELFSVLRHNTD